jgi:8-oxo-dGTP pyrophosphatase MutT (NUDIX family)
MPNQQPPIWDVSGRRAFAGSAAAVLAFIVDEQGRLLLLAHPRRKGEWEVVNGALEAGETLLQGLLREVHEEAGPGVIARPLGVVHAYTFWYDDNVQYMLTVGFVLAYEGGEVAPGDDMQGSQWRWWRLDELMDPAVRLIVPRDQKWMAQRAVELYRLWKPSGGEIDLQPPLDPQARTKYNL